MLRAHGRFLDDYRQAPLRIVNHLSRQLDLPPVLFLGPPGREPTEREQAQRIRRYLGLAQFDQSAAAELRDWLRQGAAEGRSAAELLARAEDKLRGWHIMLPAPARSNGSSSPRYANHRLNSSRRSQAGCRNDCAQSIDLLVEVPEGDARSSLFRLKDYPKSANAAVIKGDIVRLRLIEELLGTGGDWMTSIPGSCASSASSAAATTPAISGASPSQA